MSALEAVQGDWGDIPQAFVQGLRGERPGSFRDVALELGVSDRPIIPAFEGIPVLGASWAGALGFLGDVVFDPLNLVGSVRSTVQAVRLRQQASSRGFGRHRRWLGNET